MGPRLKYRDLAAALALAMSTPFGAPVDYYSRGKGGKRAHTFSGVAKARREAKRRNRKG